MTGTIRQTNLLQPLQALLLSLAPAYATHQQWHSHIFQGAELGQQIMKLPHKPKLAAAKFCCSILGKFPQVELREVYVTFRSPIKHSEYVQEGTLSGT